LSSNFFPEKQQRQRQQQQQQQQQQLPQTVLDPITLCAAVYDASYQPNFVYSKLNKLAKSPKKVSQNKYGFTAPRKIVLKPKSSTILSFNIALAFPSQTIPIFRPAKDLLDNSEHLSITIVNSQDGSSYVSNFTLKLENTNSKLAVVIPRDIFLATILIMNSHRDLTAIKVKSIFYDIHNKPEEMGQVRIWYD
jgi:hypothetical protein